MRDKTAFFFCFFFYFAAILLHMVIWYANVDKRCNFRCKHSSCNFTWISCTRDLSFSFFLHKIYASVSLPIFELLTFNHQYLMRWINPPFFPSTFHVARAGNIMEITLRKGREMGSCDSQIKRIKSPLSVAAQNETLRRDRENQGEILKERLSEGNGSKQEGRFNQSWLSMILLFVDL